MNANKCKGSSLNKPYEPSIENLHTDFADKPLKQLAGEKQFDFKNGMRTGEAILS